MYQPALKSIIEWNVSRKKNHEKFSTEKKNVQQNLRHKMKCIIALPSIISHLIAYENVMRN